MSWFSKKKETSSPIEKTIVNEQDPDYIAAIAELNAEFHSGTVDTTYVDEELRAQPVSDTTDFVEVKARFEKSRGKKKVRDPSITFTYDSDYSQDFRRPAYPYRTVNSVNSTESYLVVYPETKTFDNLSCVIPGNNQSDEEFATSTIKLGEIVNDPMFEKKLIIGTEQENRGSYSIEIRIQHRSGPITVYILRKISRQLMCSDYISTIVREFSEKPLKR